MVWPLPIYRFNFSKYIYSKFLSGNFGIFIFFVVVHLLSCVHCFATPQTVAFQIPLSMRFSRQGYWSGLPFPSPVDLPDPGIEPGSPTLQADALTSEPPDNIEDANRGYC